MNSETKFPDFKYFVDCYFNLSRDFSDLEELVQRYKLNEKSEYVDGLKNDINLLIERNDWNYVCEFVLLFGSRRLKVNKAREMIFLLHRNLNESK